MECPVCAAKNPDAASKCDKCHTPLPVPSSQETLNEGGAPEAWSVGVTPQPTGVRTAVDELEVGTVLAGRYEILQLLGRGGMGAVYKARDTELDRFVALKLIRPELARNPEMLRRFKQELILARQVTHKNVIRIFDLGQSEGIRFITMDFVEGQDLRALLLERGKFPAEQAARLMLQICRALEAAHGEGVIHRDLKPQNIMVTSEGRVYVMDFGIARSAYLPGMTQTGALVGTPEYMSPEQARGEKLTERSDLFSLGVIFYELLIGKSPFPGDAPLATLWKRLQEKAKPPIEIEATIPKPLNDIVMSALEIEPEKRLASAREMAHQLEIWLGPSAGSSTIFLPAPRAHAYWKWASAALGVLLVGSLVAVRLRGPSKPAPVHAGVSVLVADFTNSTGDAVFDETLEPPLSVALEDASFISSYNRNQARKIAAQLQPGSATLEESTARLVGNREGINYILAGLIEKQGSGYEVRAKILEASTGKILLETKEHAGDKKGVLGVVDKIAARTRRALGDTTPEALQMAAAETFTTQSLEAAHDYALAQNLQWQGQWDDAIQHYLQAVQFDSNFGRAYSGLAAVNANKGQPREAQKYYQLAMAHLDRMSDREKYRTRGGYYLLMREPHKAAEEYSALVKQFPSDSAGVANLALAYELIHDLPHAVEEARRAVEISPRNVPQRNNLGLFATYDGDFDSGIREQQTVLQMNPSFHLAHVGIAMSQLGKGQVEDAKKTYEKLAKIDLRGASMAADGLADLALYEGRAAEAAAILDSGVAADLQAKSADAVAIKYAMLAQAQLASGHSAAARATADRAVASSQDISVLFWVARVYIALGEEPKALSLAKRLASQLQPDPQAYAKLIEGEALLKRGKVHEAISVFQEAQKLADTWLGHFDSGLAYVEAGAFTEADSEIELCLKRRGEAASAFLDEEPTYRIFPPLYYYFGRVQEGLKSPTAADLYKTFVAIRGNADADPLVADARRRLAIH
jgi:serine/threonine protein kinase/tetratricopeptide (TPR) repeat protein